MTDILHPTNAAWNEDEATGQRIPKEYMGMPQALPPLGGWTKTWRDFPADREKIVGHALEAMQANVRMYERHVKDDPRNPYFADWLDHSRDDLAKLKAWMNQRAACAQAAE